MTLNENKLGGPVLHGHASSNIRSPEWTAWWSMIARCRYPSSPNYRNYGGRGIIVDPAWEKSFIAFLDDVGPRPSPQHSLDRIDSDGDYVPGNVRWSLNQVQQRNKRNNRRITINGVTKLLIDWAQLSGVGHDTIWSRIKYGWDAHEAVFTQPDRKRSKRRAIQKENL